MAQKSGSVARLEVTGEETGNHRPTVEGARSFSNKMQSMEERYGRDYVRLRAPNDRQGAQGDYPVELYPHNRYDNVAKLKAAIPSDDVGKNIWGEKTLTTDDLKYLEQKQEAQQQAIYKQFLAGLFNQKNPAEAKIFQKIHPEILEEREAIVDMRKELMLQLAKMRARGFPESREDVELIFALKSGRIKAPKGVLWDPSTWAMGDAEENLNRGFFNPFSVKAPRESPKSPFDLIGDTGTARIPLFNQTQPNNSVITQLRTALGF